MIDTPITKAIAVYLYAKLCLINFWEFLKKYLIDEYYQLMETDTDSLYIAFARITIDECVKPELRKEWNAEKWNFFSSEDEDTIINFQGYLISKKQYEKRTPGKFKEEFNGIGMICLNAKVYHIWSDKVNNDGDFLTKTSCKGIKKNPKRTGTRRLFIDN